MLQLPNYETLNVAIVGDIMLDQYYDCSIERISPEAPVMIARTDHSRKKNSLGGAGNTANNCRGLGAVTTLYSIIGDDKHGLKLCELCSNKFISGKFISNENISTIRKVRYRQKQHQLIRVDYEDKKQPYKVDNHIYYELIDTFKKDVHLYDLVILSDYDKGTLSDFVCNEIIECCNEHNIPVFVDPKGTSWAKYECATCLTPNFNEFKQMTNNNVDPLDNSTIIKYAKELISDFCLEYLVITKGEYGINFVSNSNDENYSIKSQAEEVYDVSGAGDTVISTFAMSVVKDIGFSNSIILANIAAKIVIKKSGTQAINLSDLMFELNFNQCKR